MSLESSAIHEAGHAAVMLLSEDNIGAPTLISALPEGNRMGFVMPSNDTLQDASPEDFRAYGRMLTAGAIAQRLAGFETGSATFGAEGEGGDAEKLSRLARLAGRGNGFAQECIAGAEFLLRMHWGGVQKIARAIIDCGGALLEGSGIDLARELLHEKPARPLSGSLETVERLASALMGLPEFAGLIHAAADALTPPRSATARAAQ